MIIVLILYALALLLYAAYMLVSAQRYVKTKKTYNATPLADTFYIAMVVITSVLFFVAFIDIFVEVLINLSANALYYEDARLPFTVFTVPFVIMCERQLLCEELFAYSNEFLIGYNSLNKFEDLNVQKIRTNIFGWVKITMVNKNETKLFRNIVVRMPEDDFNKFNSQFLSAVGGVHYAG